MAIDTFTPARAPDTGSPVDFKARLIKNKFGDGYRQTSKDGLNAVERSWQVSWSALTVADAAYMEAFMTNHVGQPFYYTLPRETVPRKWDCEQWQRGFPGGGTDSFRATLEERFDRG